MSTVLILNFLGPLDTRSHEARLEGFDSDKVRALLAYLAVEADRPQPREKLAGLLWPDYPNRSARTSLRRALTNLRTVTADRDADPPFFLAERQSIQFNRESDSTVDVARFLRALENPVGIASLESAVSLYKGPFLEGFSLPDSSAFEDWIFVTRESLQRKYIDALRLLSQEYASIDKLPAALEPARKIVELEPLDEPARRWLMKLLAGSGRQAEAAGQFETFRELLNEQLDTSPDEETEKLYALIRSGKYMAQNEKRPDGNIRGYDLQEKIGGGSYGVVYRANQPSVGRAVAIKVILPEHANKPDFIRRFETEAQIVAHLEHPHIVPLYDYWREPDRAYLVMRLMPGNLAELLSKRRLDKPEVVQMVEQIGSALGLAHRRGVIHRDIKPENILLDEDQNAYLTDFGIAKGYQGDQSLTGAGTVLGSPAYLSPEQVRSESVSAPTDIYALGIMLFELMTGAHPYKDTPVGAMLLRQVADPLPMIEDDNADVPAGLDRVIQKATAKNPVDRYPDVQAFLAAFRSVMVDPALAVDDREDELEDLINPYKGLRAFQEGDAADFFGRESLVRRLTERLMETETYSRFLAVVGPSGSGKSSVVKAGLLPALRSGDLAGAENWYIAEMVPGMRPFEELSRRLENVAANRRTGLEGELRRDPEGLAQTVRLCLPSDEDTLLLVIDQFEEIFTLVEDQTDAAFFLESIFTAINAPDSSLRVIVTLRADFYDQPLMHPDFSKLIQARTEVVVPLTVQELTRAIQSPAERIGAVFEAGLVTRIASEVHEQPGALPLLQYALTELFEDREGRILKSEAYQDIGGVLGALGQRAEAVFESQSSAEQELARQVFLRLVTLGEGVEDTRRRVLRTELNALGSEGVAQRLLDAYGRYRLLTFDLDPVSRIPTVEVAHEALLREWPRLRTWLDESRADVRMQRVLGNAAAEWATAGREDSFLLRGARLAQYKDWVMETDLALTGEERAYLDACMEAKRARDAEKAAQEEREQRLERRSRNFLRAMVGIFALAAVIAAVLTVYAFDQRDMASANAMIAEANADARATQQVIAEVNAAAAQSESEARATQQSIAEEQSVIAEEQKIIAEHEARVAKEAYSLSLAGNAQIALDAGDSGRALMLSMAATTDLEDPPAEVMRVLRTAAYAPGMREQFQVAEVFPGVESRIYSLAASASKNQFLFGFLDGTLILWDLDNRSEIHRLFGHEGTVRDIAFSPDGRRAISGGDDHLVILWNLETGEEIRRFNGHAGWVFSVAFSPDGQLAASGGLTGESIQTFSEPGQLFVWDVSTGEAIYQVEEAEGPKARGIKDLTFTPDGQSLLVSYGVFTDTSFEYWLVVLDMQSGDTTLSWSTEQDNFSVAISPDGLQVLTASSDNNLHIWNLESGQEVETLRGHVNLPTSVAFSPDGYQILSTDWNGRVSLWDLYQQTQLLYVRGHEVNFPWISQDDVPVSAVFSSDARQAISVAGDGTILLWDLTYAGEVRRFARHEGSWLFSVAFYPDGQHSFNGSGLVTEVGPDNTIKMWNIETGALIREFEGHAHAVMPMTLNQDGSRLLSGSFDGTIRLWDVNSGEELLRLDAHPYGVFALDISPDGKRAVSGPIAVGDNIIIWDLENGEAMHRIPMKTLNATKIEIEPDGKTAFTLNENNQLARLDLESGEWLQEFSTRSGFDFEFSPNQKSVLIVTEDVYEWDLETDERLRLFGHIPTARSQIEITPDGRRFLTSNQSGDLFLWDIESGFQLYRFHSDVEQWLLFMAMHPIENYALTPAGNGTAILWDLNLPIDIDDMLDWIAENRFLQTPTCEERQIFSILPLCDGTAE